MKWKMPRIILIDRKQWSSIQSFCQLAAAKGKLKDSTKNSIKLQHTSHLETPIAKPKANDQITNDNDKLVHLEKSTQ